MESAFRHNVEILRLFFVNALVLILSVIIGFAIYWTLEKKRKKEAQTLFLKILEDGKNKAAICYKQMHADFAEKMKQTEQNCNHAIEEIKESNNNFDQKLAFYEKDIEYLAQKLEHTEKYLENKEEELQKSLQKNLQMEESLNRLHSQIEKTLLERSDYTPEQIKERFLKEFSETLTREANLYCNHYLQYISSNAERLADRILSAVIHRCQFMNWNENHSSILPLTDARLKEKIFSPSFQELLLKEAGIKLEYSVEDASVSIVAIDSCKREMGRQVLESLMATKDFSVPCILSLIKESEKEMEIDILQTGKTACELLKIELSEEICKLLGRLKYRTSFGQNVFLHSIEVAYLAMLMASEIGLDPQKACRAGLLHDIGKAVDHEQEGGHPEIGAEILESMDEEPEIIQGVIGHHEDVQMETPYATIINAADAISASRPGARRETFEKYIKRLERLESIAYGVPGIENAYAISAGREVRVMVDPEKVSDQKASDVARDIATAIEEDLHYPGKIKITVIREKKVVEYAR